jgi:hypothetical protein
MADRIQMADGGRLERRDVALATLSSASIAAEDALIDEVVQELNVIQRIATFDVTLRMGKLIVDRFYGGNLSIWRVHAQKETSFRKLAARATRDLNVTATTLYRAVALYELTQRLGVSAWQHLSLSHVRTVLGLPEEQQRRLLTTADEARWTSKRLEVEAGKVRRSRPGGKRGRPPLPAFVKVINRLENALADGDLSVSTEEMQRLSGVDLERLRRTLDIVRVRVVALERLIGSRAKCA